MLAGILAWSAVMTVLGYLAAVVALLPSLGLLVQHLTAAAHDSGTASARARAPQSAGPVEPQR